MLEIGTICAEAGEKKEETTGTGDASETIADAASNAASSSADESANETAQEADNELSEKMQQVIGLMREQEQTTDRSQKKNRQNSVEL